MNTKYLKYDEVTGAITDSNGLIVTTFAGAMPIEINESTIVDDLIKLKNSGFTAEETIQIAKANLLSKGE